MTRERQELFDSGRHGRAKLGFVLLSTEQTVEADMFRLAPAGVGLHFTRAFNPDRVTVQTFETQLADLARAASTLLPDGSLDAIVYACTSGSLVMGEQRVMAELAKGAPGIKSTTLISCVIAGLKALGITRLALGTPYLDEINHRQKDYLEARGFEIVAMEGLQLEKDSDIILVRPGAIKALARRVDRAQAEAVFISCGGLRSIDVIQELEDELGKPVICSNQAMLWHMLRLAGIGDKMEGCGRLLMEH